MFYKQKKSLPVGATDVRNQPLMAYTLQCPWNSIRCRSRGRHFRVFSKSVLFLRAIFFVIALPK